MVEGTALLKKKDLGGWSSFKTFEGLLCKRI